MLIDEVIIQLSLTEDISKMTLPVNNLTDQGILLAMLNNQG